MIAADDGAQVRRRVAAVLDEARLRYAGEPAAEVVEAARRRLDEPLRVALAGKVKAGKSTLLNALVGARLAPTDASECTRVVTLYRDGVTYGVIAHPVHGDPQPVPFRRRTTALQVDLDGRDASDLDHLEVVLPSRPLQTMTLIDTPGIGSVTTATSARTHGYLTPGQGVGGADAVCYLMRHLHATDARFLEAFRDGALGATGPMNAIGVLSRADEVGAGRLAALESAGNIARRYRRDPQVRQLCQTVLPVAGLLAETAMTLTEDEYAALAALVRLDRATLDRLLLSVDRFTASDADVDVSRDVRRVLLTRFGVFGVRLSLALIRSRQAATAAALSAALIDRSGIVALRTTLVTQFADRADLLKARAALTALSSVLDVRSDAVAHDLAGRVERIVSQTHAFAEARLLNALRAGHIRMDDAGLHDAERLLGGLGPDPADRLGLSEDGAAGDPDVLQAAALDALERWRRRAEHPLASRANVEAARVVARSCEGMIIQLPPTVGGALPRERQRGAAR